MALAKRCENLREEDKIVIEVTNDSSDTIPFTLFDPISPDTLPTCRYCFTTPYAQLYTPGNLTLKVDNGNNNVSWSNTINPAQFAVLLSGIGYGIFNYSSNVSGGNIYCVWNRVNSIQQLDINAVIPPSPPAGFSPNGGNINTTNLITIIGGGGLPGNLICYYTINGSTPTTSSSVYTVPFTLPVGTNIIIKTAIYNISTAQWSNVIISNPYTVTPLNPDPPSGFNPNSGTINTTTLITITGVGGLPSNLTCYYTTDGTTPTTSSFLYSVPFTLNVGVGIHVKANIYDSNTGLYSTIKTSGAFNVSALPPSPPAGFSPNGGNLYTTDYITISGVNNLPSNLTCYYTTDGTTPTTSSSLYSAPFNLAAGTNIYVKAIIYDSNTALYSSVATSNVFNITPQPPSPPSTFNPNGGNITTADDITIIFSGSLPSNLTCYYTTDGTTPTTSSFLYSVPFTLSAGSNIIVTAAIYDTNTSLWSSTLSTTFNVSAIPPNPPTGVIPNGGNITTADFITLLGGSGLPSNLTCYYTTDNSTPNLSSNIYINPFNLAAGITVFIKAAIYDTNTALWSSVITSNSFTITSNNPNPPTGYTPNGGSITSAYFIIIAGSSNLPSNLTCYYTTDGTTPTQASAVYTTPFNLLVGTNIYVKAAIYDTNTALWSTVLTSYSFTVTLANPAPPLNYLPNGGNITTADFITILFGYMPSNLTCYYTTDGSKPTLASAVYTTPFTLSVGINIKVTAAIYDTNTSLWSNVLVSNSFNISSS